MTTTLRKRNAILQSVGMKMLEEGRILNKREYEACGSVPVRSRIILSHFGSWSRLINLMRSSMPDLWRQIELEKNKVIDPLKALGATTK